jgi:hypothetical protein
MKNERNKKLRLQKRVEWEVNGNLIYSLIFVIPSLLGAIGAALWYHSWINEVSRICYLYIIAFGLFGVLTSWYFDRKVFWEEVK